MRDLGGGLESKIPYATLVVSCASRRAGSFGARHDDLQFTGLAKVSQQTLVRLPSAVRARAPRTSTPQSRARTVRDTFPRPPQLWISRPLPQTCSRKSESSSAMDYGQAQAQAQAQAQVMAVLHDMLLDRVQKLQKEMPTQVFGPFRSMRYDYGGHALLQEAEQRHLARTKRLLSVDKDDPRQEVFERAAAVKALIAAASDFMFFPPETFLALKLLYGSSEWAQHELAGLPDACELRACVQRGTGHREVQAELLGMGQADLIDEPYVADLLSVFDDSRLKDSLKAYIGADRTLDVHTYPAMVLRLQLLRNASEHDHLVFKNIDADMAWGDLLKLCKPALRQYSAVCKAIKASKTKRADWHLKLRGRSAFEVDESGMHGALTVIASYCDPATAARLRTTGKHLRDHEDLSKRAPHLVLLPQADAAAARPGAHVQFSVPQGGEVPVVSASLNLRLHIVLASAALVPPAAGSATALAAMGEGSETWTGMYLSAAGQKDCEADLARPKDVLAFSKLACHRTCQSPHFDATIATPATGRAGGRGGMHVGQVQPSPACERNTRFEASLVCLTTGTATPLHALDVPGCQASKQRGSVPQPRWYSVPEKDAFSSPLAAVLIVNLSRTTGDKGSNFTSMHAHAVRRNAADGRAKYVIQADAIDVPTGRTTGSARTAAFEIRCRAPHHSRTASETPTLQTPLPAA